jgi:hypothetical protein
MSIITLVRFFAAMLCLVSAGAFAQPAGESRKLYPSGRVKELVVKATIANAAGLRQTEYYEDGKVKHEFEWVNGRLNGMARSYLPGEVLAKEARFANGRIVEYTAYKGGRVETRISADRRSFVHRGAPLTPRWDKYYERLPGKRLLGLRPAALVDVLLQSYVPESVTKAVADLNGILDSKTGGRVSQANDIVACGSGRAEIADDLQLQQSTLVQARAGGRAGVMQPGSTAPLTPLARAQAAISNISRACGSTSVAAGRAGVGGPSAQQSQNARAEQALNDAVTSCRSGVGRSSSDLVGIGPGTGFTSIKLLEAVEALEAAEAAAAANTARTAATALAAEGSVVAEATIVEGLAASAVTESAVAAAGLSVMAVAAVAVASWEIGKAINDSPVGQALTNAISTWQTTNDANYQEQAAAAQRAQEQAAARAPAPQSEPATPPGTPIARPDPDSAGRNRCDYLASFKDFCTSVRWTDRKCSAYSGIVNRCVASVTQIQVNPHDGDPFAVACPRNHGDRDALALQHRCDRLGMISRPGPDGGPGCGQRPAIGAGDVPRGPNPNQINPTRGSP